MWQDRSRRRPQPQLSLGQMAVSCRRAGRAGLVSGSGHPEAVAGGLSVPESGGTDRVWWHSLSLEHLGIGHFLPQVAQVFVSTSLCGRGYLHGSDFGVCGGGKECQRICGQRRRHRHIHAFRRLHHSHGHRAWHQSGPRGLGLRFERLQMEWFRELLVFRDQ